MTANTKVGTESTFKKDMVLLKPEDSEGILQLHHAKVHLHQCDF